jgi:hypothetical protein
MISIERRYALAHGQEDGSQCPSFRRVYVQVMAYLVASRAVRSATSGQDAFPRRHGFRYQVGCYLFPTRPQSGKNGLFSARFQPFRRRIQQLFAFQDQCCSAKAYVFNKLRYSFHSF